MLQGQGEHIEVFLLPVGCSFLHFPQRRNEHDLLPSATGGNICHQAPAAVPGSARGAFLLCQWHCLAEECVNLCFVVFLPALTWPV